IELGGTIGDIEGMPFVEAFRQFARTVGADNFCCVHVSLVPKPKATGEHKTKPTQVSVKELRALGLSPDLIVCRSEVPFSDEVREKISNYCHVNPSQVICLSDQSSIYRVPLELEKQGLVDFFCTKFGISNPKQQTVSKTTIPAIITPKSSRPRDFQQKWRRLAERFDNTNKTVSIALVGKYTKLEDSYASVIKALQHSALAINRKLAIHYIEGSDLEEEAKVGEPGRYYDAWQSLVRADGILVPGGFGDRGVEGKILAIRYARENRKPFLGVCLGYQCAVLELARNVLGEKGAESQEVNRDTPAPFIVEMPEHHGGDLGGTMRVGRRETRFTAQGGVTWQLYKRADRIYERHRHRYEVNPAMVPRLEAAGLAFVGRDTTGERMEIAELRDHPYFVGVQFHPEYTSRPLKPSPVYHGLLLASAGKLKSYL
ncbi:PREDICTED: CTP synthase 1-B-like, partial [Rhagoletis zephyria]|uniref:CTP synthase 1-B-like n=1 Tax=Rhagoletis zephyria TaxID=28612 RepID=UPI0008113514